MGLLLIVILMQGLQTSVSNQQLAISNLPASVLSTPRGLSPQTFDWVHSFPIWLFLMVPMGGHLSHACGECCT